MFRAEGYEDAKPGEVIELRVHGVAGSTPETLLQVPYTELVAGDLSAGFFRPPGWIPINEPRRVLEGYSWGGLTSRTAARALWLLLLPFALVNVAGWMFRHDGAADQTELRRRSAREAVALGLLRLFALNVTVGAWVYVAVIGLDIVGYQCAVNPSCPKPWWLWP